MFEINGIYRLKYCYNNEPENTVWYRCMHVNMVGHAFMRPLNGTFDEMKMFIDNFHRFDKVGQR